MIEPKMIKRTNRKSIALTINEKGELIVTAPKRASVNEIFSYIEEKKKWITTKQSQVQSILRQNDNIVNYSEMFFVGARYKVLEVNNLDESYMSNGALYIKKRNRKNNAGLSVKQFLLDNTSKILVPRINKLAKLMKLSFNQINIISSIRKWGMCDQNGNLYFNFKLLMLSPDLIDYVIVHELSHLIELNHSSKFWEIVGAVMPDYKERVRIIKKCGFLIRLF